MFNENSVLKITDIPKEFFFGAQAQEVVVYSPYQTPNSELDFTRLLAGNRNIWKFHELRFSNPEEKKAVIISSWDGASYQSITFIGALIALSFNLFVLSKQGELIPIENEKDLMKHLTPGRVGSARKIRERLKRSFQGTGNRIDHYVILDYWGLSYFSHQYSCKVNQEQTPFFYSIEISQKGSQEKYEAILECLREDANKIQHLTLEVMGSLFDEEEKKLLNQLTQLESLKITGPNNGYFLFDQAVVDLIRSKKLNKLVLKRCEIFENTIKQLDQIKELELYQCELQVELQSEIPLSVSTLRARDLRWASTVGCLDLSRLQIKHLDYHSTSTTLKKIILPGQLNTLKIYGRKQRLELLGLEEQQALQKVSLIYRVPPPPNAPSYPLSGSVGELMLRNAGSFLIKGCEIKTLDLTGSGECEITEAELSSPTKLVSLSIDSYLNKQLELTKYRQLKRLKMTRMPSLSTLELPKSLEVLEWDQRGAKDLFQSIDFKQYPLLKAVRVKNVRAFPKSAVIEQLTVQLSKDLPETNLNLNLKQWESLRTFDLEARCSECEIQLTVPAQLTKLFISYAEQFKLIIPDNSQLITLKIRNIVSIDYVSDLLNSLSSKRLTRLKHLLIDFKAKNSGPFPPNLDTLTIRNPYLQQLDLTGCCALRVLSLENCPRLTHLILPSSFGSIRRIHLGGGCSIRPRDFEAILKKRWEDAPNQSLTCVLIDKEGCSKRVTIDSPAAIQTALLYYQDLFDRKEFYPSQEKPLFNGAPRSEERPQSVSPAPISPSNDQRNSQLPLSKNEVSVNSQIAEQPTSLEIDDSTYTKPGTTVQKTRFIFQRLRKNGVSTYACSINPSDYRQHVLPRLGLSGDKEPLLQCQPLSESEINQSGSSWEDLAKTKILVNKTEQLFPSAHQQNPQYLGQYLGQIQVPVGQCIALTMLTPQDRLLKICGDPDSYQSLEQGKCRYNRLTQQYEMKLPPLQGLSQCITIQYSFETPSKEAQQQLKGSPPVPGPLPDSYQTALDRIIRNDSWAGGVVSCSKDFPGLRKSIRQYLFDPSSQQALIKALSAYFSKAKNAPLQARPPAKGEADLRVLLENRGVCRHRAFFFVLICQYLKIPARVITNQTHAYIEYFDYEIYSWIPLDLGGASVQIQEKVVSLQALGVGNEPSSPTAHNTSKQGLLKPQKLSVLYNHYFAEPSWVEQLKATCHQHQKAYFDVLYHKGHGALLTVSDYEETQAIYAALSLRARALGEETYFIACPEDLAAGYQCHRISSGRIESFSGPLERLLKEGGLLVIDWSRMSPDQIDTLSTLLEKPPHFFPPKKNAKPITLSEKLRIITLSASPDSLPTSLRLKLTQCSLPPRQQVTPPSPLESENKTTLSFNFSNCLDWQKALLGIIELTPNGLRYQMGLLGRCSESEGGGQEEEKEPEHVELGGKKLKGITLELINPPKDDLRFQSFLRALTIERRLFLNGTPYAVPDTFTVHCVEQPVVPRPPLAFAAPNQITLKTGEKNLFFLTPNHVMQLFRETVVQPQKSSAHSQQLSGHTLLTTQGWLGQVRKSKQPAVIVLTEAISEHLLYVIQDVIQEEIQRQYGPEATKCSVVDLHSGMGCADRNKESSQQDEEDSMLPLLKEPSSQLIFTADPYFAAEQLRKALELKDSAVFDLTPETDPSHLLTRLELLGNGNEKNPDELLKEISYTEQDCLRRLLKGETVILRGTLPKEVYQQLQTLWAPSPFLRINGQNTPITGRLLICSYPVDFPLSAVSYFQKRDPSERLHSIPWKAYQAALCTEVGDDLLPQVALFCAKIRVLFEKASKHPELASLRIRYAQLYSLWKAYARQEDIGPLLTVQFEREGKAWKLLTKLLATDFPPQNGHAVIQNNPLGNSNLRRLEKILDTNRVVFLIGPPGWGKTTAANYYMAQGGRTGYWGEDALLAWLTSEDEQPCLLLDEANLRRQGMWEFLSPLLNASPQQAVRVCYQGKQYELRNHRVIFTGNPNYYSGRNSHPILDSAPSLLFEKWSDPQLEAFLLRLFEESKLQRSSEDAKALSVQLREAFRIAEVMYPDLASLRDLKQIVLRWKHLQEQASSELSDSELLFMACRNEWIDLNSEKQALETKLENLFLKKPAISQNRMQAFENSQKKGLKEKLLKFIEPEQAKQAAPDYLCGALLDCVYRLYQDLELNAEQGSEHLGKLGTLVEETAGLETDQLMRALLKLLGYTEYKEEAFPNGAKKVFCCLTLPTANQEDSVLELLEEAFRNGWVVILKKLDKNLKAAKLLNGILTGARNGEPLQRKAPGFYLLATRGDAEEAGSNRLPPDLLNRLHNVRMNSSAWRKEMIEKALPYLSKQDQEGLLCQCNLRQLNADQMSGIIQRLIADTKHKTQVKQKIDHCSSKPSLSSLFNQKGGPAVLSNRGNGTEAVAPAKKRETLCKLI